MFRLVVMSVMAWVVYRVSKRAGRAFVIALIGSAAIFAFPHLERPLPADPMLADYYRAALMTKYTLLGVPLGWVFWRWGLRTQSSVTVPRMPRTWLSNGVSSDGPVDVDRRCNGAGTA